MPCLVVQGTHDLQVAFTEAALLQQAKPRCQVARIADMNHVLKLAPADMAGRDARSGFQRASNFGGRAENHDVIPRAAVKSVRTRSNINVTAVQGPAAELNSLGRHSP